MSRLASATLLLGLLSGCIRGHAVHLLTDIGGEGLARQDLGASRRDGDAHDSRRDAGRGDRGACAYACAVDLSTAKSTCAGAVTVTDPAQDGRAMLTVDLAGRSRLTVVVSICDPVGWVLNIGDSPTNNGGGGDGGQFSNDAEVQILDTTLTAIGNDNTAGTTKVLLTDGSFLPAKGCVSRELRLSDGRLETVEPGHSLASPHLLRLNQPDSEGAPDALFYVALNRVVAGEVDRVGSGLLSASLCID